MWTPSTPVTGGAQTGLTSPTYTLTADTAPPSSGGKQHAVTALGGTQTGVTAHSIARPFTATFSPPKVLQTLEPAGTDGIVRVVPKNTWKLLIRAGVLPLAGQANAVAMIRTEFQIPVGSDTADPAQLRAMISLLVGLLNQQSAGIGDTVVSGIY